MKYTLLILCILNLLSCNNQTDELPESKTVAVVGDKKVTADMYQAFLQANGISNPDKILAKKAFDKLIDEVAMANMAEKDNLKLTTLQLNTLKYLRIKSQASNAANAYLKKNPISEKEIETEYKQANIKSGLDQYHVHHLLFKDEVEAIKQREKLHSVADYLAYEKTYLLTNTQSKSMGDLGWVNLSQLPKEFSNALKKAQVNQLLNDVVITQFGAHIVYLEAKRPMKPPPLESVKAGITKALKAKKILKYTQLARAKAHVKVSKE
jgi:peptidyl-prolyl cis-trans isomerase C